MLGKLISSWRRPSGVHRNRFYLDPVEFQRELARERVRSMRRSYPFCVLLITHRTTGRRADDRRQRSVLAALLLRHTRWTDHKATLAGDQFAVIFTDTPEMGGRVATPRAVARTNRQSPNQQPSLPYAPAWTARAGSMDAALEAGYTAASAHRPMATATTPPMSSGRMATG